MTKYTTKQRTLLLDFFTSHHDTPYTAHQIAEELKDSGISLSAVYRNLADMEAEHRVRKLSVSGSREVYYQFTDVACCRDRLHLSCEKCGKTFHLSDLSMQKLLNTLQLADGFTLDKKQTVLFGICSSCRRL